MFSHLLGALLFVSGLVLAGAAFEAARRRQRPSEIALLLGLTRVGVLLVATDRNAPHVGWALNRLLNPYPAWPRLPLSERRAIVRVWSDPLGRRSRLTPQSLAMKAKLSGLRLLWCSRAPVLCGWRPTNSRPARPSPARSSR